MRSIVTGLMVNWHFMRLLRLGFAVVMLISYFTGGDKIALFGAIFFGYQAVFNVGCCGTEACYAPAHKSQTNPVEINYEEIKKPNDGRKEEIV